MKIARINRDLDVPRRGFFPPGEYLAFDLNAAEHLWLAEGDGHVEEVHLPAFDPKRNWDGRKILLIRPGGFGDLLFLTPIIRELHRRWPGVEVDVACSRLFAEILRGCGVDSVVAYPVAWPRAKHEYDAIVGFEDLVEKKPRAHEVHIVDLFAERLGLAGAFDKSTVYAVNQEEQMWAVANHRKREWKRLGVQVRASALLRTYPTQQLWLATRELHRLGWEIYLFGRIGDVQAGAQPRLVNVCREDLPIRRSCALLASCDVFLGPDSALTHVAGALGVPTVALYGPFLASLRTAYQPSIQAIQASGRCAPCFWHEKTIGTPQLFPPNCPSAHKGVCGVLASIRPDEIVAAVLSQTYLYEQKRTAFAGR